MAHYDLVRGWIGLKDHEIIDFAEPYAPSLERGQRIRQFLDTSGLDTLAGTEDGSGFEMAAIRFDKFIVSRVISEPGAVRWRRTAPATWRRMLFAMVSSGSVTVTGSGPTYTSNDGDIIIVFPGSTPMVIEVHEPSEFLMFSFDENATSPSRLTPDNIAEIKSSSCIFQATHAYLRTLVDTRSTSRLDDSPSMRAMTRSMAQALTAASIRAVGNDDLFSRANSLILDQGGDPDLDPSRIADSLEVSKRTLYRAFSENQTTVAHELLVARTNHALELLRENPDLPTKLLVQRSGFASESSMRRALRARSDSSLGALRESLRLERAA